VRRRVIKLDQCRARRVLHLREPYLADETARVGILETDPHTRNLEARRHFHRSLNDFVSAALSLIAGRSRLDNQAAQPFSDTRVDGVKDVLTLGSPGSSTR
jgi:hypothetical protein